MREQNRLSLNPRGEVVKLLEALLTAARPYAGRAFNVSGSMVCIGSAGGRRAMQATRRRMILTMTSAVAAALAYRPLYGQTRTASPRPMASPNAPQNENVPAGLDGAEIPVNNGQRRVQQATWLEIKSDAQRLLDMAADFNRRVDHTNLGATLPLALIKEARRIEKLAKKIQTQMKG